MHCETECRGENGERLPSPERSRRKRSRCRPEASHCSRKRRVLTAGKPFSVSVDPKYVAIFKHTCITCGKTYKHKHHLKRHHDFECGVDPKFKCAFCPHRTRYKDSLMKHILARHQHFLDQNSQYDAIRNIHQQVFEAHTDTEMNFHAQETNTFNVYPDFTQNL